MSSTNRGAQRDLDDHYATPPAVAKLICLTLRDDGWVQDPALLLEPGCGEGSFLDAFRKVWPEAEAVGIDLNQELVNISISRGHEAYQGNFLSTKSLDRIGIGSVDAAIGNPPFSKATQFIRRGLKLSPVVAYILRLNFLGSKLRFADFWQDPLAGGTLAHIYVLPARVGFTSNGLADSIEYGVFIFKRGHKGWNTMSFLDNTGIQNKWKGETWHWRRKHGPDFSGSQGV